MALWFRHKVKVDNAVVVPSVGVPPIKSLWKLPPPLIVPRVAEVP